MAAVLVHLDLDGDRVHAASLVALATGRTLASTWGATLYAGVIASDHAAGVAAAESVVAAEGADRLVIAPCATPIDALWSSVGHAWQAILDQLRPRVVLFGAEAPAAHELAGRTAARIGARLFARARIADVHDNVELRDRAGTQFRFGDSGAAVALVGAASRVARGGGDLETIAVTVSEPAETRVEAGALSAAPLDQQLRALVVIADSSAREEADALARLLGGHVALARDVAATHAEVCVRVGDPTVDVAGCALVVDVATKDLGDLVRRLERS